MDLLSLVDSLKDINSYREYYSCLKEITGALLQWNDQSVQPDDRLLRDQLSELEDPILANIWTEIGKSISSLDARLGEELSGRVSEYWSRELSRLELSIGGNRVLLDRPNQLLMNVNTKEVHVEFEVGPVFWRGGLEKKEIALTFDDGPHSTITLAIAELLGTYGIRCNYFVLGENAIRYPFVVQEVVNLGHHVGSHTFTHANLPSMPLVDAKAEIKKGREAVQGITQRTAPFFRFPYGARTRDLQAAVRDLGIATFFWNMDSRDWAIPSLDILYANVLGEIEREQGGIILLHDVHKQTELVLPMVISYLASEGYTFVVFRPGGA